MKPLKVTAAYPRQALRLRQKPLAVFGTYFIL